MCLAVEYLIPKELEAKYMEVPSFTTILSKLYLIYVIEVIHERGQIYRISF